MSFSENYQKLKNALDLNSDYIDIPGTDLMIRNFDFESALSEDISFSNEDCRITENFHFRYPVILKKDSGKTGKAIIFLHGLNERTWYKHLTGAEMLAQHTGRPVILFPLSFHINRGLPDWNDIRKMADPLAERKSRFMHIKESTVINLALSKRLTDDPGRFLLSGFQSINDLSQLMKTIKSGLHPLFDKNATIDLFAYSISCMLIQSLMISNPGNLLKGSRIVLFAGGSVFEQMNGISRYIMDSVAFSSLRKYYLDLALGRNTFLGNLRPLVMEHKFGKAFRSLISANRLRTIREKGISVFHKDLLVISLRNDHVMPVSGIMEATGSGFARSGRFKVLDFPYPYTHENPFPVLYNKLENQVEQAFFSVFHPALRFFCRESEV